MSRSSPQDSQVDARSLVAYGVGRLVPGFIVLASVPVWLRLFSPSAYGTYSLAFTAAMTCTALGTGWIRQSILRSSGRRHEGFLDHPMFVLVAVVITVAMATVLITRLVLGPDSTHTSTLWSLAAFSVTYATYTLTQTALQRAGAALQYNVAEIARALISLLVSAALYGTTIDGASCILLGGTVGNACGLAATFRPREVPRTSERWAQARRSWAFGWPLSLWLGISALTLYVDRFILGRVASGQVLGNYSSAADLVVRGFSMVAMPIILAAHPNLMTSHNLGDRLRTSEMWRRWSGALLGILAGSVLAALLIGPLLVGLVLGHQTVSRGTLVALAAGAALWQYALMAHKPLEMARRTRSMLVFSAVGLSVEVAVSVVLVQSLGPLGVALGLTAGALAYLACVFAGTRRARKTAPEIPDPFDLLPGSLRERA